MGGAFGGPIVLFTSETRLDGELYARISIVRMPALVDKPLAAKSATWKPPKLLQFWRNQICPLPKDGEIMHCFQFSTTQALGFKRFWISPRLSQA